MRTPYENYNEASKAAIKLEIKTYTEYQERYKEDDRLPSRPDHIYKDSWVSFSKFLGNKTKTHYASLREASKAAIALNISSQSEYNLRYKEDPYLPAIPAQKYKKDWKNWYEFLGKKELMPYRVYIEASQAAADLGITSALEYNKRYKEDPRLPSNPHFFYKKYWHSWLVFLKKKYSCLDEVHKAIKNLDITNFLEYTQRYKEDKFLVANPARFYQLESNAILFRKKLYETYAEASAAAISLGITSFDSYRELHKKDSGLPASPDQYYKEWESWYSFLKKYYPTAIEAREVVLAQGIESFREYKSYRSHNSALPPNPIKTYGLKSFKDFINF